MMSLYLLSGRFAQVTGLIMALVFGAMWVGAKTRLPLLSPMAQAFIDAAGTPRDMLFVGGTGFLIFVVGTIVFAVIGDVDTLDKNLRDFRKSGRR